MTSTSPIVALLVPPLSSAQNQPKSPAASPTILLNPVATDFADLARSTKALESPACNGHYSFLDHPTSVAEFVGGRVNDIRIVRFAQMKASPTKEELRNTVEKVWHGKFQSASCQIDWAEGTFWSIDAVVEFVDGKRSELITDGSHVALQDHGGKSWFLRLLPAAQ